MENMTQRPKPLLLVILDGFGVSPARDGNPVASAAKPNFDNIEKNFPFTTLQASGIAVGLPWGEPGNSEVGHLTMGAGRVVYHHLPRIMFSITDGSFFSNEAFLKAAEHIKKNNSRLHIAGLISSGSVHSYIDHLFALLQFAKEQKIAQVFIHVFTDGKDAQPHEAATFLTNVEQRIAREFPNARIASIVGRSYTMDRNGQWDHIRQGYNLLTNGEGERIRSPLADFIQSSYAKNITDAFLPPASLAEDGIIKEHDACIFLNFREDSMRELLAAFVDDDFRHFQRRKINDLFLVTMTEYQKNAPVHAAFPPLDIAWPLARVLGDAGLRHLHIAESGKYAHVTYFFNGGREDPFPGEERILIPSLMTAHVDERPEMRARDITKKIIEQKDRFNVIIANFANADMVGHSGNLSAAINAVEVLDESIGALMTAVLNDGGVMIVTGDHGNIERKRNLISGEKMTKHSINPVPFYLIGNEYKRPIPLTDEEVIKYKSKINGMLADVAPTILDLLSIQKPLEMRGTSLLPLLKKQLTADNAPRVRTPSILNIQKKRKGFFSRLFER